MNLNENVYEDILEYFILENSDIEEEEWEEECEEDCEEECDQEHETYEYNDFVFREEKINDEIEMFIINENDDDDEREEFE